MKTRWCAAATAAALGLLLVVADTASAQRFFGRRGMGGGYYGSGMGYGGMGYGGMGYGGLGYGNSGWGGYYPYTSYGYSPGSWSGFTPSYGYTGSYYQPSYGYTGVNYGPGYVSSGVMMPGNTTAFYYQPGAVAGAGYGSSTDPNAATIDVRVPSSDAQVWFDGDSTTQRGSDRLFSSPPLDPGKTYHYEVRARWTENGKSVDRTKRVEVRAGQRTTVDFGQDQGLNRDTDRNRDLNRDRNTDLNRDRNSDLNRNNDLNRNRNPEKPEK